MLVRRVSSSFVLGKGVGKTSIVQRVARGNYSYNYRSTIGCDFMSVVIPMRPGEEEEVTVQLWDTAGQERFMSFGRGFYRHADIVLLCADSQAARGSLAKWRDECLTNFEPNGDQPQFLVVLTKSDLGISKKLKKEAEELKLPIIVTSAKENIGIAELKAAIGECAWGRTIGGRRFRAMQQAAICVQEMYRLDRACFAGIRLPRDVVEHCILPAIEATAADAAWDRLVPRNLEDFPVTDVGTGKKRSLHPLIVFAGGAVAVAAACCAALFVLVATA